MEPNDAQTHGNKFRKKKEKGAQSLFQAFAAAILKWDSFSFNPKSKFGN